MTAPSVARAERIAWTVQIVLALLGLAVLLLALRMNDGWAHRHFLPAWAWSWATQMRILLGLRLAVAAAGLAVLLALRPWAVRTIRAGRLRQGMLTAAMIMLAVSAALATTELVLRTRGWRSVQERWDQEPLRVRDPVYGWAFAPDHEGWVPLDGRRVHYATGPHGYRAPRAGIGPDLARPTIVFAGESIVFGYGLDWAETVPAQVEAMTGIQAANIAVNAHATDQTLLRLTRELPRFRRPVAVVIPFMPRLFDRNLDRDRPHLDAALRWHPGTGPSLRLVELGRRVIRYRGDAEIREGRTMTQRALQAMIAAARARGARPVVLVPQFLPEQAREREVRRDVLDRAGIPYLLVPIDGAWRSPSHGHPDRRGARALAAALVTALGAPRPRSGDGTSGSAVRR
jgi:hypothetical protein